ncbi:MAG: hypothetical protein Kow0090_01300 [Myxococcota bacterium]
MAKKKSGYTSEGAKKGRTTSPATSPLPLLVPLALGGLLSASFVYFDLGVYDQYEFPKMLLLRMGLAALIVICFFDILMRGFPTLPSLMIPVPLFLAALALSTVFSVSPTLSFYGTYESGQSLWAFLTFGGLFFISAFWVRSEPAGRWLFRVIAAGLFLLVVSAFIYRFGYDFPSLMGYETSRSDPDRIGATMGNPNFLAAVLYTTMPLVGYMAFAEKKKYLKSSFALLLALMLVAIGFTGSRTGYIMPLVLLIMAVSLAFYLSRREKGNFGIPKEYLSVGVLSVAVGIAISRRQFPRFFDSLIHPFEALSEHRLYFWIPALKVFAERPFFGAGVDTFKITAIHHFEPIVYKTLGPEVAPLRAHNEFLNMLATTGVAGTATWLLMLGAAIYYGFKASRLPNEKGGYLARAAMLGIAALFVGNLLNFGIMVTRALEFVFMGVIAGIYTSYIEEKPAGFSEKPKGKLKPIVGIGLLLSIVFFIFIVSDCNKRRAADNEFFKAYLETRKYDFEGAIPHLKEAIRLVPNKPKYLFYIAQVTEGIAKQSTGAKRREYAEDAEKYYRLGLELEPPNPSLLTGLGRTLSLLDRKTEALNYLSRAVELAPGVHRYRSAKFSLLLELGNLDEAKKEAEIILRDWGDWENFGENSLIELGKAYSRAEKDDDAVKIYERANALFPDSPAPYFHIAVTYAKNNRNNEALKWLEKALAKDPAYPPALDLKKLLGW